MRPFLSRFPNVEKQKMRSGSILFQPAENPESCPEANWSCLITGPGVFNTAMGLSAFLETRAPDVILNTGIAGAYAGSGLVVGDIAVAIQEKYLHTGVGNESTKLVPLPFNLIPGVSGTKEGCYNLDSEMVEAWFTYFKEKLDSEKIGLSKGPFLTVSAISQGLEYADVLWNRFSPVMESMEGAAAAHTAESYGVPFLEIRAASNLAGERDKEKWNFDLALDRVSMICEHFVC
ncbi:MAG: futalosine hydrolase [Desulfobacterales bacterium]|nr:futalosine hydrolase [Desulfobacterales bacterium]